MAEGDGDSRRMEIQTLRQTLKNIALSNEQIECDINIIKEEIISLRTEWNGLATSFFSCTLFFFLKCIHLKSILSLIYEYFVKLYLIFYNLFFQSSTEGKSFIIQTKHIYRINFQHSFNDYLVKQLRKDLYHLIRLCLSIGLKDV